jgi:hypothetical protein
MNSHKSLRASRLRSTFGLPESKQRRIVQDVPRWSKFIQQETERYNYPYIDMSVDFSAHIDEAKALLTSAGESDVSLSN